MNRVDCRLYMYRYAQVERPLHRERKGISGLLTHCRGHETLLGNGQQVLGICCFRVLTPVCLVERLLVQGQGIENVKHRAMGNVLNAHVHHRRDSVRFTAQAFNLLVEPDVIALAAPGVFGESQPQETTADLTRFPNTSAYHGPPCWLRRSKTLSRRDSGRRGLSRDASAKAGNTLLTRSSRCSL